MIPRQLALTRQKKVYYAHAMWLYGTRTEQGELLSIRSRFSEHDIVNPSELNRPEGEEGIEFYKEQVSRCDVLVFSRLAGEITTGVGLEINHALSENKPVFELEGGKFVRIRRPVRFLTRQETRDLFSKLPPPGFMPDY